MCTSVGASVLLVKKKGYIDIDICATGSVVFTNRLSLSHLLIPGVCMSLSDVSVHASTTFSKLIQFIIVHLSNI